MKKNDDVILSNLRNMIAHSILDSSTLSDLIKDLDKKGVCLVPQGCNSERRDFLACFFVFNGQKYTSEFLGKRFSAKEIIKKGISYCKVRDYNLLERAFVKNTLIAQQIFISSISSCINTDNLKIINNGVLLKTGFLVRQFLSIADADAEFIFETECESRNKWSQVTLDSKKPAGILLKKIIFQKTNTVIDLHYESAYSLEPVNITMSNNKTKKNLANIIETKEFLLKDEFLIISESVPKKTDSEITVVKQWFLNCETQERMFDINRFHDNYERKNYLIIPSLI